MLRRARKRQLEEAFGNLNLGTELPSHGHAFTVATYGHGTFGSSLLPIAKRHNTEADRELQAQLESLTIVSASTGGNDARGRDEPFTLLPDRRMSLELHVGLCGRSTPPLATTPSSLSFSESLDDGYENEEESGYLDSAGRRGRSSIRKNDSSPIRSQRRRQRRMISGHEAPLVPAEIAGTPLPAPCGAIRLRKEARHGATASISPLGSSPNISSGLSAIRPGRPCHRRRHQHAPSHHPSQPSRVTHPPHRSSSVSSVSSTASSTPIGRPSTPTASMNSYPMAIPRRPDISVDRLAASSIDSFGSPNRFRGLSGSGSTMCLGIGRGAGRRDEMPRPQNLIADSILMSLAHEITQTEDIQNEDMCNARTRGRSPVISKPTESQTQAKHVDHQSRSHSSPPDNRATAPSNTSLNPEPSESSTLPIRSVSPPPVLLGMKTPHRRHLHSPSASPSTKPSRMKLATGMVIDDGMTIGQRVAANRRTPQMASIVRHEDDEMGYADDEGGEEEDGVVREFKGGLSPPVLSLQKTKKSWRVVGGDGEDMVMSVVEEPVTVAAPSLMSLSAEDNGWSTVGTSDLSLGSMSNNTATSWWAPPNSSWPASVLSLQPSSSLPWVDDTGLMALAAESPLSVDDMCVDDGDAAPSRVAKPIPIYRIRETVEGFGKIPAFLLRPVSPLPVSSINTLNPDRSQLILYRPVSAPPSLDDASTSQKIVRFARRKVDGNDGDDDGEGRSSAAIITASRSKIHHHHNHNPLQQKTTSVRMLGVEEAGLESGRMDLD